jgi:hypothetical protein
MGSITVVLQVRMTGGARVYLIDKWSVDKAAGPCPLFSP